LFVCLFLSFFLSLLLSLSADALLHRPPFSCTIRATFVVFIVWSHCSPCPPVSCSPTVTAHAHSKPMLSPRHTFPPTRASCPTSEGQRWCGPGPPSLPGFCATC
jgi:hypothetical protein